MMSHQQQKGGIWYESAIAPICSFNSGFWINYFGPVDMKIKTECQALQQCSFIVFGVYNFRPPHFSALYVVRQTLSVNYNY